MEKTLLKVDADLAEGNTAKARQRLTSLVDAFPERLDVRERLAGVCRLQGDSAQAGRWSYLAEERIEAEVSSFEKATRDPVNRMRALQWPSSPDQAATPVARQRLEALLERTALTLETATWATTLWRTGTGGPRVPCGTAPSTRWSPVSSLSFYFCS